MPRIPIDYSKCIMYKIVCNDLTITDVYVGNTTDFTRRNARHKSTCHNEKSKNYNFKIYQIIRQNGGYSNWTMVLVENYPCFSSIEARARERYFYELLNATMNSLRPYVSKTEKIEIQQQYEETNKEKIADTKKAYYVANIEKIAVNSKAYYVANKEKKADYKKVYREANTEKMNDYYKAYRENNKEKITDYNKAYNKAYYEANKEKLADNVKSYQKANKEKIADSQKAYRERIKNLKNI